MVVGALVHIDIGELGGSLAAAATGEVSVKEILEAVEAGASAVLWGQASQGQSWVVWAGFAVAAAGL